MQRVWTDGACKRNPGPGGWAWVAADGSWASGCEAASTNQRMEIVAAWRAIEAHPGPVAVVSDSTYVVNCFRDRWWEGWLTKGWVNSQRKPVANRDLWEPFIGAYRARMSEISFEWVKGHSGDEMNDLADRLAVRASETQVETSGGPGTWGEDLGPAIGPSVISPEVEAERPADRDRRLPAGRLIGVFGAKPPALGGYDANPVADAAGRRLQEVLAAKRVLDRDLHVVSGLRLGAEMLGAEAAVAEGIPLVVVLPFPDPDKPWSDRDRRRFQALRSACAVEIVLERKAPVDSAAVGGALSRRDAWLARNLDEAIVVSDRSDRFQSRLLRTLRDHLGDDVWEEPVPAVR